MEMAQTLLQKRRFFQEINKSISKYGEIKGTYCYEFSDTEKMKMAVLME